MLAVRAILDAVSGPESAVSQDQDPVRAPESRDAQPDSSGEPAPETLRTAVPDANLSAPGDLGAARRRWRRPTLRGSGVLLVAARRGAARGVRGAARGGRSAWQWAHGPAGRVAVPGLALIGVMAASGVGGRWLVSQTAPHPATSASAAPPAAVGTQPSGPAPVQGQTPDYPVPGTLPGQATVPARPVDALRGWATKISATVGISPVALAAYGYAQLTIAQTNPGCHLSWTTLAGIGEVESNHGTANGAVLQPDGKALPPIVGDPLDGQGGRTLVRDTDGGLLDGDRVYDRAVGPMQFLPSTWQQYKMDGDGDGIQDPNDINDAALTAGQYLCAGGRDLSTPGGWWGAILSYNAIQSYAQSVFSWSDTYGQRSRTVT